MLQVHASRPITDAEPVRKQLDPERGNLKLGIVKSTFQYQARSHEFQYFALRTVWVT